ncbi:hypothetical protein B0H19DRAFT_1271436 [Mycena capillaripes]|nr:hypothetical protein B0H19DRAFT_1271436 [Mycena capillaripes]
MLVDPAEHPVPSLRDPSSNSEPGDPHANEDEKAPNRARFSPQKSVKGVKGPRGRLWQRSFLSRLIGRPAFFICGQLLLQIAAWGFFIAVQKRSYILLPYVTAVGFRLHQTLVTVIVVIISTALQLFSWSAVQSIVFCLSEEGMPLEPLISSIGSSKRMWGIIWIVTFAIGYIQGDGLGRLLTPDILHLETPLTAHELDLSSPLIQQMEGNGVLDYCVMNSTNLPAFYTGQMESGYAAVKSSMGLLVSFTLMDQTFNVSTAGIIPLTLENFDANSWFPSDRNVSIPSTVTLLNTLPDGALPLKHLMKQQGLTADVSCAFRNLTTDDTSTIKDGTFGIPSEEGTLLQMSPNNCIVPDHLRMNFTRPNTVCRSTYVLMAACGRFSPKYTLIFVADGPGSDNSMGSTVCTLIPKITRVQVEYTNAGINTTQLDNGVPDLFAQAIFTNVVGDELQQAILDVDSGFHNETTLFGMEQYIRGVAEYSGSVLRACLSLKNGTFINGAPVSMTVPSEGFLYSEIVGWTQTQVSDVRWVLISGTIVGIASIFVILMAVAW